MLYRALVSQLAGMGVEIRGIYERSESPLRAKEGLDPVPAGTRACASASVRRTQS